MGQRTITNNTLFFGDNLEIIRQYLADESVDLIYLDPPFNSNRNYNVLYKDESGLEAESQIVAFEDTWHWNYDTNNQYRALAAQGDKLSELLEALIHVIGRNQMTAYLVMMASRLLELHRVLKPTGSLYLHCDPTASHYLKMVLDAIFGARQFQNEIIWQRTSSHNDSKKWGAVHDVILFYSRSDNFTWNPTSMEQDAEYLKNFYRHKDERGIYRLHEIIRTASMGERPNLSYEYKGYIPRWGWRVEMEKLVVLDAENRLVWSKVGRPYLKRYLEDHEFSPIKSVITDIPPISGQAAERLGYPTQKPLALLERIIQASSNPGEVILDPFCGCGTAVHAAQKLGRVWIGVDITPLATALIKSRLYNAFNIQAKKDYDLIGEPTTLTDAQHLAQQDRYQFQWWALGLLPARPFGGQAGAKTGKKGADKGIDGIMTFRDSANGVDKRIIVQVKSGKVSSRDIRDLNGTVDREKNAVMGVFVTLEPPSHQMELEVMELGDYHSVGFNRSYPKIQILTIEQLLDGARVQFPGADTTLKQAQREQVNGGEQKPLL